MLEQISPAVLTMLAASAGLLLFVVLPLSVQRQTYSRRPPLPRMGGYRPAGRALDPRFAPLWPEVGDGADVAWRRPQVSAFG